MTTRERIMTIRLIEKLQAHPSYAKVFGIEICTIPSAEEKSKEI